MIRKIAYIALAVVFMVPLLWSSNDGGQSTALREVHPETAAQLYGGQIAEYCGVKILLGVGCGNDPDIKGCVQANGEVVARDDDGNAEPGSWTVTLTGHCGVRECGAVVVTKSCTEKKTGSGF